MLQAPGEVVLAYLQAIATRDMANARPYLADDAVLHNPPLDEVARFCVGADAICARVQKFLNAAEKAEYKVLVWAENGTTVLLERHDCFWFPKGTFPKNDYLECPVCSHFEVVDGKITLHRDYYVHSVHEEQLGVTMLQLGQMMGHNYGS